MATPARQAAQTYLDAVNAKDLGLLRTIFADDVTLLVPLTTPAMRSGNPTGIYRGVEETMGFFSGISFRAEATLTYTHVYEAGDTCVAELSATTPGTDRVLEAVDIFTVGDGGLVTRMAVYARVAE